MQRFNLVDEPWLPIAGHGLVSLRSIFERSDLPALGGTVLEKIAINKLLQAIAQAACTPKDDDEWQQLGEEGMARACLDYLERWRDAFWLYHPQRPFLQFPKVAQAKIKSYGHLMPEAAAGNNTILFLQQVPPEPQQVSHDLRARLVLVQMSCCFSGKQVDQNYYFSPDITDTGKKKISASFGPALDKTGLLHSFIMGQSVRQGVWLNLLTKADVAQNLVWGNGVGTPPWEEMPEIIIRQKDKLPDEHPTANAARALKHSLMGRLVPMARFLLLSDETGVHYAEGLRHENECESGLVDPSTARIYYQDRQGNRHWRIIPATPAKRPWRSLAAILNFRLAQNSGCPQLEWCMARLLNSEIARFHIWSGGISLHYNSGEQKPANDDDVMESEFHLETNWLRGKEWFLNLQDCMGKLEELARRTGRAIENYYDELMPKTKNRLQKNLKNNAAMIKSSTEQKFWQQAELIFPALVSSCQKGKDEERKKILSRIRSIAIQCYEHACPQNTARQLQIFVKHYPRLGKEAP